MGPVQWHELFRRHLKRALLKHFLHMLAEEVRDSKSWEYLMHCCWFKDGGRSVARNVSSLQEQPPTCWQPAKKLGPKSYNRANKSTNKNEHGSRFFFQSPQVRIQPSKYFHFSVVIPAFFHPSRELSQNLPDSSPTQVRAAKATVFMVIGSAAIENSRRALAPWILPLPYLQLGFRKLLWLA